MKHKILLLETIADDAMEILSRAEDIETFTGYDEASLRNIIGNESINGIITRGKGQVNETLISAFPALKTITRCGVGLDNVDVMFASKRKVKVVNAPGSNSATIAEHTISLMLMLQRNLYQSINEVKAGNWDWRKEFKGDEINGKTLGILGLGNIGKRVAKIAEAMGMNVVYWNLVREDVPYQFLALTEVLKTSDIVTLHLPLTPETENLINGESLKLMKPTAILINTARGGIIDQKAVAVALANSSLAGFGADVLIEEPPRKEDEELINHPSALITAHVGSLTARTYTEMCVNTVRNTLAILRDKQPEERSIFNHQLLV
jgi:phosphoglycerate dehydrogenase-like enzyme